jgi:hypothetical protein
MLYPVELRDRLVRVGRLETAPPSERQKSWHPAMPKAIIQGHPERPTLSRDLHNIAKMKNLLLRKTIRTGFAGPATKACGGLRLVAR